MLPAAYALLDAVQDDAVDEGEGMLRIFDAQQSEDDLRQQFRLLQSELMAAREYWTWIGRFLKEIDPTVDRWGRPIVRIRFVVVNDEEMWTRGHTIEDAIDTARTFQRAAERVAYRLEWAA